MITQLELLCWRRIPGLVEELVKEAAPAAASIRRSLRKVPTSIGYGMVYWHPKKRTAWAVLADSDEKTTYQAWQKALELVPDVKEVHIESEEHPPQHEGWMQIKRADPVQLSDVAVPVGQTLGHRELPFKVPGWPSPLASLLAGGAIGGGLGYGTGALLEKLMPGTELRRTLAVAGALGLGGVPSLAAYLSNRSRGKGLTDSMVWSGVTPRSPRVPLTSMQLAASPVTSIVPAPDRFEQALSTGEKFGIAMDEQMDEFDPGGGGLTTGAFYTPSIKTDAFNNVVWQDPFTPPAIQAAATGLVTAAALQRGGFGQRSSFVSPFDVARIGMGLGSGYLSGAIVGKTFGALAGLSDSAQQKLQQAGMFAGLLKAVVPLIF